MYCFLNGAEFFELGAKGAIVGVPCKATAYGSVLEAEVSRVAEWTYPIKSLDMTRRICSAFSDYHRTQSLHSHTKRTVFEWIRK